MTTKFRIGHNTYRKVDARPDVGDVRDYIYRPSLASLRSGVDCRDQDWWSGHRVRDQGQEPYCTGYALASIIDHLRARDRMEAAPRIEAKAVKADAKPWASAKMLYSIARYHDAWPGEDYNGSSIRGVLQGFYFNGVCSEAVQKEQTAALAKQSDISAETGGWHMNREILDSARSVQLGAYYRVRSRLSDMHAALNEVGLVLASADIHDGWGSEGDTIDFRPAKSAKRGRHAFVVVGYDETGFIIQNSWGRKWKDGGFAHWHYDDWAANIIDQWVLRLAAPMAEDAASARRPQVASNRLMSLKRSRFEDGDDMSIPAPSRLDVIGHVVPLSKGNLDIHGHYHTSATTLLETANIVRTSRNKADDGFRYHSLLIHIMDFQPQQAAAVAALRDTLPVFKQNGVYPVFVMLENDMAAEVHRMCAAIVADANDLVGLHPSEEKDRLIEGRLSLVGHRLVREIENSAERTMKVLTAGDGICDVQPGAGSHLFMNIFERQQDRHAEGTLSYHFSAHGFGAALLSSILKSASYYTTKPVLSTVNLIAPMLRRADLDAVFMPLLVHPDEPTVRRATRRDTLMIERLHLSTLSDAAHRNDPYLPGYGRSWPELWSRIGNVLAGEKPGSEAFAAGLDAAPGFLALEAQARAALDHWQEDKNITGSTIDAADGGGSKPRHLALDMRLSVLDDLLALITGGPGDPKFTEYYVGRDSCSYSHFDG